MERHHFSSTQVKGISVGGLARIVSVLVLGLNAIPGALADQVVWDGGGADNLWSTQLNWSDNQMPGPTDDIHFDATSSKPCVINVSLMVHHFTVASGYGGMITFEGDGAIPVTVLGDFNQEVATINWMSSGGGILRLLGDYRRSGGVSIGGTFALASPGIQNFDPGLGQMFVNQFLIEGPGSQVLNIEGGLRVNRFLRAETSGTPGTVNLLGGVTTVNQSFEVFFPDITLNVLDGAVLDARGARLFFNEGVINEIGTGKVLRDASSIQFTDSVGHVVNNIVGGDIFVTVVDEDENSNGSVPDTLLVEVFDIVNNDREMLVLDETGPATGQFRNINGLPTTLGPVAVPFDGIFLHDGLNNIFASYVDEQAPEDELLGKLFLDFIWDETGPNTNWENSGNWNLKQTPDLNANVVFGNFNYKPCVVNVSQRLANFTMEPHYRGVLSIQPGAGFIVGQPPATGGSGVIPGQEKTGMTQSSFVFHQRGGTIVWGGVTELWGDLIRTGGVALGAGDFIMQGPDPRSFVAGPLGMQVLSISVRSDAACLVGDISVLNLLEIASVATTKIIGETRMVSGDLIISPQSHLFIQNGSVLDARDANLFQNMGRIDQVGIGRVLRDASFLAPIDIEGTPLGDILPGDPLFVRLIDEDENEDGSLIDHVSVRVSNLTNGDVETILLQETDPLSGTFQNPQPIPTLSEPPVPGNGQLEGQPGDRFEILYVDDEDPKDILAFLTGASRIFATPRILTFGARDVNAINQPNRLGKGLSSSNQTVVTIRNDGTEDLVFDPISVNLIGPDSDSFSAIDEFQFMLGHKDATLADLPPLSRGESLRLFVFFDPFEAGIKRARMVISSNDPNEPEARVAMGGLAQVRPHIISVVYRDVDQDFSVGWGDTLTVVWDQAVFVTPELLNQASFFMPFDTDNLGDFGFSVEQQPSNDRQTIITLGNNATLFFNPFNPFGDGKTPLPDFGLDINANLPFGAVLNRFGLPAVDSGIPGVNDTAVPIIVPFIPLTQMIDLVGGGEIRIEDAPFVSYTKHSLVIPPGNGTNRKGGADDAVITLGPPSIDTGQPQAVQIESSVSGLTFDPPAILTLEYLPSDWDSERGQTEGSMILCQLVETEDDVFGWVVVPGMQDIDTDPNIVTILIHSLDPVGGLKGKSSTKDNGGSFGIFANLPGETIKPTTFRMSPSQSPEAKVILKGDAAVITLDPERSIYAESSLEIPGYELTDETDPDRIEVTLRSVQLLEKLSISGGTSFPSASNALLVVETSDAVGLPVEFTAPVNFNVEFKDGTGEGLEDFFDLFNFENQQQAAIAMRLARDMEDEFDVDFGYATDLEQMVDLIDGGGRVQITGITNLTGPSGQGTWGAVANPDAVENSLAHWELFE